MRPLPASGETLLPNPHMLASGRARPWLQPVWDGRGGKLSLVSRAQLGISISAPPHPQGPLTFSRVLRDTPAATDTKMCSAVTAGATSTSTAGRLWGLVAKKTRKQHLQVGVGGLAAHGLQQGCQSQACQWASSRLQPRRQPLLWTALLPVARPPVPAQDPTSGGP